MLTLAALSGLAGVAQAEDRLRIATWNVGLERAGPGLLLRDIAGGRDPQIAAVLQGLVALDADAVLLTGVDFDLGGAALAEVQGQLAALGAAYPWRFALPPNTGVATGLDLDGDGRRGGARDAQGWGRFAGAGGMAILSRLPIAGDEARDFSAFLWADLPGALLPDGMDGAARRVQRLATTGFWEVPLILPDGGRLLVLAWHATPPVFDGPEDRNGRRNHDEAAFWLRLLAGEMPFPPPAAPFVLMGDANLDPVDGDGRSAALVALLASDALQDLRPRNRAARTDPGHSGDAALDTVLYDPPLGGLRLDYVLPAAGLSVLAAGVLWPDAPDPLAAVLEQASRHRPVWVDLDAKMLARGGAVTTRLDAALH
ncbi:MAG: endonuclease [Rhodobacteraceae bacterium PARR1]|nr:MAG: endonuclease [Rhodobacteraceae bacterium PARR1]